MRCGGKYSDCFNWWELENRSELNSSLSYKTLNVPSLCPVPALQPQICQKTDSLNIPLCRPDIFSATGLFALGLYLLHILYSSPGFLSCLLFCLNLKSKIFPKQMAEASLKKNVNPTSLIMSELPSVPVNWLSLSRFLISMIEHWTFFNLESIQWHPN